MAGFARLAHCLSLFCRFLSLVSVRSLRHASLELQDDDEVVTAAVTQSGEGARPFYPKTLEFASQRLRFLITQRVRAAQARLHSAIMAKFREKPKWPSAEAIRSAIMSETNSGSDQVCSDASISLDHFTLAVKSIGAVCIIDHKNRANDVWVIPDMTLGRGR